MFMKLCYFFLLRPFIDFEVPSNFGFCIELPTFQYNGVLYVSLKVILIDTRKGLVTNDLN